jgi:hypothetical protein
MAEFDRGPLPPLPSFDQYTPLHQILGVSEDADEATFKRAWRRLAMSIHPDHRPPEEQEQATRLFQIAIGLMEERAAEPAGRESEAAGSAEAAAQDAIRNAIREILRDILRYRHIFDPNAIDDLPPNIRDSVRHNLLHELGEQIVSSIRLGRKPEGIDVGGTFENARLIVTNLRFCLMVATSQTAYRTKTTTYHHGWYEYYEIEHVVIVRRERVRKSLTIQLQFAGDRFIRIRPVSTDVTTFILLCSLWGNSVDAEENPSVEDAIFDNTFGRLRWVALALLFPLVIVGVWTGGAIWPLVVMALALFAGVVTAGLVREYGSRQLSQVIAGLRDESPPA